MCGWRIEVNAGRPEAAAMLLRAALRLGRRRRDGVSGAPCARTRKARKAETRDF
jgi:hypothetical protein